MQSQPLCNVSLYIRIVHGKEGGSRLAMGFFFITIEVVHTATVETYFCSCIHILSTQNGLGAA